MRRHHIVAIAVACFVIVCASPVLAQQNVAAESTGGPPSASNASSSTSAASPAPPAPREWFGVGPKWSTWSRMTGDWNRARTTIENRGLSFELTSSSDGSGLGMWSSGVGGFGRNLMTAGLTFDFEKLAGLKGSRALVQYQTLGGLNGALEFSSAQAFSNIDADPFRRFAEVWFEQQVGAKLRVKTGLIDANTEFACLDNTGDFINSSMGYSPTVFPLPTYPDPHFGLVVHVDPTERTYASAGVFNGGPAMGVRDFDALFAVGEAGLRWNGRGGGRIGVGYWRVGGQQAEQDAELNDVIRPVSTGGQYVVFDQTLWSRERNGIERSVGAFFQAGLADPRMSATSSHIGAGLVGRGLVGGRPDDTIGVGVTFVGVAAPTPEDRGGREIAIEAFHRFALTKWVGLKPDVQFIKTPLGTPGRRVMVAGTVRIEVVF